MSGSASGASTKKRKKQENNTESQRSYRESGAPAGKSTKCANEKRRRDQENHYIEELAELISVQFTNSEMSLSVKPDKCAILKETVDQIRTIKKEHEAAASSDAVQQGEVSSSKPTILTNEVFGPLLLEALEGFLFVVNSEGKIEFCTENITQFIKYRREEVLGQPIYNIIHVGDHGTFSSWLLPMTVSWGNVEQTSKPRTFNCRFLINPNDSTVEQQQQRPSKYENMQISSTQLPQSSSTDKDDDGSSDSGPCLMCVARRIPLNDKPIGNPLEQFTMKLNTSGRIIGIDYTGVSAPYSQFLTKDLVHRNLEDLVHGSDVAKVSNHLKEALTVGQSTSSVYKLQVSHEKFIQVQTKLKLFKSSTRHEPDFIMATHSIIGENETNLELGSPSAGGSSSQPRSGNNNNNQSQQGSTSSSSTIGGPLMASVNGANTRDLGNTITLNNSSAFQSVTLNPTDLDFNFDIFPTSTWELGEDRGWERPESRQSLTPVQSPLYSNPPQPSPAASSFSAPYAFSPIQESAPEEPPEEDSGRLRNLLMTKRPSTESDDGGGGNNLQRNRHQHRILKGLLNQDDEESQPQETKPPNNMLLKLLNTQHDDDSVEVKAGLKNQNELLQQLLKEEENNQENQPRDDGLLKSLGFRGESSEESRGGRKRPSSEESEDQPGAKRPLESLLEAVPPAPVVSTPSSTSTGKSKLWEQNKMLASLLERRPTTPTSIPPIPASVISATPQDKFPRLPKHPQAGWSGGSVQTSSGSPGQSRPGRSPGYTGNTWDSGSSDPVLSDILDQVIEIVPDVTTDSPALMNMINSIDTEAQQPVQPQFHQDFLNEKMAINAIQKSLMLCESAVKGPAYSPQMSQGSPQPQQQFPPPPMYQQRQRFPLQQQQQIRQQFNLTNQQQQLYLAQRTKLQQQQQLQKQRLLHLQQQQQLVIPSNAAASSADPTLHNIDSLINNTVAPNVSLQRSSSVPDSQLSPVASYPGLSSVPSPGQRRPFSPVNGGMTNFSSGGSGGPPVSGSGGPQARLSPSSLQGYQQPQLSPRLPQQGQQSYGGGGTSWSQQSSRLSLQQQENPVLNAQLTSGGRGYSRGGAGLPSVRSLPSPQRFSSPAEQAAAGNAYPYRLQRQVSAPQPQQSSPNPQLPGGTRVGYGGSLGSPPLCHHPGGVYQEQQYCYQQDPAYPPRLLHHSHGGNNGVTEYVRQELRAMVGARTSGSSRPQVPGSLPLPTPVDLESLAFDIQTQGVSDTSKMWGSMSEMGAGSPQSNQQLSSRNSLEEVARSSEQKSSLLQKLLSE